MKTKTLKALSVMLAFLMIAAAMPISTLGVIFKADAAEVLVSGKCGDNLTWEIDDERTLTVKGSG